MNNSSKINISWNNKLKLVRKIYTDLDGRWNVTAKIEIGKMIYEVPCNMIIAHCNAANNLQNTMNTTRVRE